jgi:integrase/recombinase XerD
MNKVRREFLTHLQLRGYSPKTIIDYIYGVSHLAKHFNKSPLLLTPKEVRDYLLHIRNVRKLAVRTYNQYFYSIKCFYDHFFPNQNFMGDLRRMREPVFYPVVLSKQEVDTLIDAAPNLKIKAAIAILYSSGIRVEECSLLKMSCIERHWSYTSQ